MDIPLNADVRCTDSDEVVGHSTVIVLNPVTEQVTHFAVKTKGLISDEYIVPVDLVTESTHRTIRLRCTQQELAHCDPFLLPVDLTQESA